MQSKNIFGRMFLVAMAMALVLTWGIAPAIASGDNRGNEDDQNQGTTETERGTTTGGTETQRGTGTNGSTMGTQRGTTGDMSGITGQPRFLVVVPTSGKDDCQEALQDFSSAIGRTGATGTYTQRDGSVTGRTNGDVDGSVSGRVGTNGGDTDVDVDVDTDTDRGTTTDQGTNGTNRGTNGTTPGHTTTGQTGMGQMSSWQWGCNNDDQTIYLFTNATSETSALQQVPNEMRDKAKVIRLGQFGNTNIQQNQPMKDQNKQYQPDQNRGTGSGSGSGTGGY